MSMRIENKKRASELCENPLALQSLKNYDGVAILSISMLLGFVQCFFMRGHNATEPRAYQLT